jgi:hypothetical protein
MGHLLHGQLLYWSSGVRTSSGGLGVKQYPCLCFERYVAESLSRACHFDPEHSKGRTFPSQSRGLAVN